MPYFFAGVSTRAGIVLKLQYYPGNFMNSSYSVSSGATITYPYANYSANLMYISIGISPNMKAIKDKKTNKEVPKRVM